MIIGKAISPFALRKKNGGAANDPDAQLFITATGISGTNATATNQLVIDLKAANIWTKMKAVYPMVGGTSTTCKFNLKNPVDSNAAYRLTFFGGGTFSSNGYQPNGINSFADTFLTPSTALTLNSTHFSIYSRTDGAGGSGGWDSGINGIVIYSDTIEFGTRVNDSTYTYKTPIGNTTKGLFIANRISLNTKKLIQNTNINNYSINSTVLSNIKLYLSAMNNNGTATGYDNKQCAFASIGDGLTDAESLAFYNAVQTFNTTLGRQV